MQLIMLPAILQLVAETDLVAGVRFPVIRSPVSKKCQEHQSHVLSRSDRSQIRGIIGQLTGTTNDKILGLANGEVGS